MISVSNLLISRMDKFNDYSMSVKRMNIRVAPDH